MLTRAIECFYADSIEIATLHAPAALQQPDATTAASVEQIRQELILSLSQSRRQLAAWRKISLHAVEAAEIDRLEAIVEAAAANLELRSVLG